MNLPEIVIDGKVFRQVKLSRRGEVAVYTNGELYARVGERGIIERMLALHKNFCEFGFPVPEIMGKGEIAGRGYFLEKSLGEKCFSYLFQDDIEKHGAVSPELFEKFISVTEKFAAAQLHSLVSNRTRYKNSPLLKGVPNSDLGRDLNPPSSETRTPPLGKEEFSETLSFTELIRPNDLAKELPEYGDKILKLYEESISALKVFPQVLTQGDFCSHNLFPAGVIDFEKAYCAPAGYDIVTNIFQNDYFPASREHEYYQLYSLTKEQKALYYKRLDALYAQANLPALSKYRKHFEYCRAAWHTARNSRMPKLQKWRYELFRKQYL